MPHSDVSSLRPGDHACALYSGDAGRAKLAADFLVEGLTQGERCWYVGSGEHAQIAAALRLRHGVDVASLTQRGALQIIGSAEAYVSQDGFDPERTLQVFNDAIEQALQDGYAGFRAVADMTWALSLREGPYVVIAYEAMLRSLFATCRATGLCLYDRHKMPLDIIDGALATHPFLHRAGGYHRNPQYNPAATGATRRRGRQ